jgi:hypothetical protein
MPELNLDTWLKPEDIKKCNKGKFIDEGKISEIPGEGDKPGTPTFEIGVELDDGTKRVWTINKTSQRAIAQSYGMHTAKWIGKHFEAFLSLQNVNGRMKEVIYAKTPEI